MWEVLVFKMDMQMCKKSLLVLIVSMIIAGVASLFFLTPIFLGFFVIGATSVVSAIFSVESKSHMEFFYACFPVRSREYIAGRCLTCFVVLLIPSVISILFTQIGMHFSLCQIEDIKEIVQMLNKYQNIIICSMIMLGFVSGANLILVSFTGKIEVREIMEVLLLLVETVIAGGIITVIQKVCFHGNMQELLEKLNNFYSNNKGITYIGMVGFGILFLWIAMALSVKIKNKKKLFY